MSGREKTPQAKAARNHLVAACAVLAAVAMVGAAYAAVPLYFMFCRATGFAGTTQVATAAPALKGQRVLTVRLDANVAPGLPWSFEAETASVQLRTGATATVYFKVRNRVSRETAATAVYNVSPGVAGAYFDKISCFCFSEQHLGPDETAELPVVFFLDPRLEQDETLNGVQEITLSYTLFAALDSNRPVAAAPGIQNGESQR
ncbi:cytochrome c oxidase assembly protein [Methylocapsa sp. S129]|uniref:cytochrome c oxidase assembly protein n=1 Tax=Methylocapsa sp. S129 TaxID=1641869 RepID=UPI00131E1C9C|nr:cytochrome c oxidase assembly protein [Methylocapsa sp. S129]